MKPVAGGVIQDPHDGKIYENIVGSYQQFLFWTFFIFKRSPELDEISRGYDLDFDCGLAEIGIVERKIYLVNLGENTVPR